MINITVTNSGDLSAEQSFSEIYLSAVVNHFTGGLLLLALLLCLGLLIRLATSPS